MDDQAYLEPGFDPSTLTVPQLRSKLVAHNVNYPSSAKKSQLIDLFNEHVARDAARLRAARARVKRTSRGIEDMPASQSTVYDDEDEVAAPPSTATRSGRRTTRAKTEEAQEVASPLRATRHSTAPPESTPRRASSKHARVIEEVEEEATREPKRPASRKSRLSAATPAVKADPINDDSPFSSDNVFQSGYSSPPAQTDRRHTLSAVRDAERRRSREMRRRTEEVRPARVQMDGAVVPTRKTFDAPAAVRRNEELEPGEDFTPEEQHALIQAEQSGEVVRTPRRAGRPASRTARNGITAVIFAVVAAFAGLWGQEKFSVGYCHVGHKSTEIAGVEIPAWADAIRPQCEPCPPHAICDEKFETKCEPGFLLTQHPLSLGGILPFPPTCEPDSATARKVDAVKERAIEELREQNAKYVCGEAASAQIPEPSLKSTISSKRRKGMSDEEFEALWDSAQTEIAKADEVTSGADGSGHFTFRSSSLARVPLACAIRRSLRETLRQYFWQLVAVLLVVSSAGYGRYTITAGRETEARAKQLASLALEKLSLQASLHANDPNTYRENYISMAQLRDDVLRDEFSSMRRKKLWEKVQHKVERNSNVRPMVREGRSGDVGRVWEWVGTIGMLESPPTSNDRRKTASRVSFGSTRYIEPKVEDSSEMSEIGKWEEGRQYY